MTVLVAAIAAIFGAWWLSNGLWWSMAKRVRSERAGGGEALKESLRWFVWTTYIPFSAACFFFVILIGFSLPQKLFWSAFPFALAWFAGSALLIRFGDRLPVVGPKSKLALRTIRKQSTPFATA